MPSTAARSSATRLIEPDARSTFERPPAGVRNPDASHLDLSVTHSHGFAMPRSEPERDQISEHADAESMVEQVRTRAAVLTCIGEQFERTPVFCGELTFLMQNAHRILLRREAASVPGMILVSPIVRANPDITEAFASR
jgi:hypothetical protein